MSLDPEKLQRVWRDFVVLDGKFKKIIETKMHGFEIWIFDLGF